MISRFIKNNFKVILAIIITAIICISGAVFATGYFARDITYKNGKNVEEALNELYLRKEEKCISKKVTIVNGANNIDIGFIPKRMLLTNEQNGIFIVYDESISKTHVFMKYEYNGKTYLDANEITDSITGSTHIGKIDSTVIFYGTGTLEWNLIAE